MATKYTVTGAYVTVKTMTDQGVRIVGLYAGAPVPADAGEAWVQHHLDNNLIEAVPAPEKPHAAHAESAHAESAGAKAAAKPTVKEG